MITEVDRPDTDTVADAEVREVPTIDPEAAGGPAEAPSDEVPSKGKGSKWNALKHSLMAKSLFTDSLVKEITHFTAVLTDRYLPATPFQRGQIAIMGRAGA